ncbi:olfactory receptor 2C1-like [Cottoperca gobio]|uniref:Olfactory receptor 2C1-like n=1 Tax=Cottoperca gobio TaxID=56716 RepID=A0A6J2PCJ6_COTGO|nr:olfactory receptor 2C1-like [Cottoperca gobio]
MASAGFNVSSVTPLTLVGVALLSDHRWFFFSVLSLVYVFVLLSDSLVVYLICCHRTLHRPMFIFVAAVLLNSLAGSSVVYPKLLSDLLFLSGGGGVQVSRAACLCQAFGVYSLGASSFMLLSAMAFDRYVSICHPLRYTALLSPAKVVALLLLCWLLPAVLVGGMVLLASRLPLCHMRLNRMYCDILSFTRLSCGGAAAKLSGVILSICLRRSQSFSNKALHTCLPHLLVFIIYSTSVTTDLLLWRLGGSSETGASVIASVLMLVVPNLLNPVVYGLKMKEVFIHVKKLLSCRTDS